MVGMVGTTHAENDFMREARPEQARYGLKEHTFRDEGTRLKRKYAGGKNLNISRFKRSRAVLAAAIPIDEDDIDHAGRSWVLSNARHRSVRTVSARLHRIVLHQQHSDPRMRTEIGYHLAKARPAGLFRRLDLDVVALHQQPLRRRVVLEQLGLRCDGEAFLFLLP
jgi:hypothetical protein